MTYTNTIVSGKTEITWLGLKFESEGQLVMFVIASVVALVFVIVALRLVFTRSSSRSSDVL